MYAAEIGRIIFERWQQRESRPEATVREFFDQEFFPMFFNDERYLMFANNSKFDQAYKNKKKTPLTAEVRTQALNAFHADVESLEAREGHLYMGGFTRSREDATAGQITDLTLPLDTSEVYFSWLGLAAGIGVKGGMSILTTIPEVLDQIVEGWPAYRRFMKETPSLKPHQIDTWNGWWLYHRNDEYLYRPSDPLRDFTRDGMLQHKDGVTSLQTIDWSKVMFTLSEYARANESLLAYVYSLGQTNISIGFMPMLLNEISRLPQLYERLFGTTDGSSTALFKQLYDTDFGFVAACRMGAIGLRALQPKDLASVMTNPSGKTGQIKIDGADYGIHQKFHQTWIIAMLNNEELLQQATHLAEILSAIGPAKRGKKTTDSAISAVLDAPGKRQFIEAITNLLKEGDVEFPDPSHNLANIDKTITEIVKMPVANVPLFITLLRYKYAFINHVNS